MKYKKILQVGIGIIVFIYFFTWINDNIAYHNTTNRDKFNMVYEKDIDVAIVGSSHAGQTFNAHILNYYLDTSAHTLQLSASNLFQSYYFINELLDYNDTELFVLELYTIFPVNYDIEIDNPVFEERYRETANEMKFSSNKVEFISTGLKDDDIELEIEEFFSLLFPIFNSHINWKEKNNIYNNMEYTFNSTDYGFKPLYNVMNLEQSIIYIEEEYYSDFQFTDTEKYWLSKILDLLADKEKKLILTIAPMYNEFLIKSNYNDMIQELEVFLEAYPEVVLLDFNSDYKLNDEYIYFAEEDAIRGNGDINDNQHMNYIGSYYASKALSDYIYQENILSRNILDYEEREMEDKYIFSSFINSIDVDKNIIIVALSDMKWLCLEDETVQKLSDLGINIDSMKELGNGFFVNANAIGKGTKQYWTSEEFIADFNTNEALKTLELPFDLRMHNKSQNLPVILINDTSYHKVTGLNIVVYDIESEEVTDWAIYDFEFSEIRLNAPMNNK